MARKKGKSRVLVCYNCQFKKAIKDEIEALIITRTHNLNHDLFNKHIMRVLDWEETQTPNTLPFYKGFVYRAVCECGDIFDRKTRRAVEYAMELHLNIVKDSKFISHSFDQISPGDETFPTPVQEPDWYYTDDNGNVRLKEDYHRSIKDIRVIDRQDYVIRTRDADVMYQEAFQKLALKESDIPDTTALVTFDENIFWSNDVRTFNYLNTWAWKRIHNRECPGCGGQFDIDKDYSFRDLYWHFYRKHYLVPDYYSDHYYSEEGSKRYGDTCLSMLQQFVLVEDGLKGYYVDENDEPKKRHNFDFRKDRLANALYQLNRKHGIPFGDLDWMLKTVFGRQKGIGDSLFHGMVWSENKAPTWLDTVVDTYGKELGI